MARFKGKLKAGDGQGILGGVKIGSFDLEAESHAQANGKVAEFLKNLGHAHESIEIEHDNPEPPRKVRVRRPRKWLP